jgi:putative membrane protein
MAKKLGQRQASRRPATGDPQGRRSPAIATLAHDDRAWFPTLWQIRGSVVPAILPRVLVCSGVAALVAALHQGGWSPVALPLAGLIPSIVLGLLLVFRTNTAYDRFWEGRKLWGTVTNESRNLARQIWWAIAAPDADAVATKVVAVRTVAAYAYALKAHLRQAPLDLDAEAYLPAAIAPTFATVQHRPLVLAAWLEQYLQTQVEQGHLDRYQRGLLTQSLNALVNSTGGCERILRTPMPYAYAIHLRQLLLTPPRSKDTGIPNHH